MRGAPLEAVSGTVESVKPQTKRRIQLKLSDYDIPMSLDLHELDAIQVGDQITLIGAVDHDGIFSASAYHNHTQNRSGHGMKQSFIIVAAACFIGWGVAINLGYRHPVLLALVLLGIYLTRLYFIKRRAYQKLVALHSK